jgi:hypothetical protein
MAGRTSFEQITEADFSSLLEALSASEKGRRFLDEYRHRNRSEEALRLFDSLKRIETTIAGIRGQLPPGWLTAELLDVAMTLEIALDGAAADPEGDDAARRFALVSRARVELASLAGSLGDGTAPLKPEGAGSEAQAIELTADQSTFFRQLGLGSYASSAER